MIWLIILMRQVVVIGCCNRLFVQVWCMVDALVHGTGLVQVGAWWMHLFMVQVGAWLMHLFMV